MSIIGCVADDVTGATDIASVLAAVGRSALVVFDVDRVDPDDLREADALVVALKSRTAPVEEAMATSTAAMRWTRDQGASTFFFKYCSTFDSTPEGNIGPVIDALLAELGLEVALVAPAYPRNGRTVYQGRLFVGHVPLDESPMRYHPLTPMRDASLERLLQPQTALGISSLYLDAVRSGRIEDELAPTGAPRIVIADAIDDADLVALAHSAGDHVLLTGGAGLALGLGDADGDDAAGGEPVASRPGERLILSGSASATTRRQVAHAREHLPALKLDPARIADEPAAYAAEVFTWVTAQWTAEPGRAALVYATDALTDLDAPAAAVSGDDVERVLGLVAQHAAPRLGALIVAGGETSGRVVQDLGIASLRVGQVIAPGVVWTDALAAHGRMGLALKSGNFGADDMFTNAWELLA
ncbi:3-oxo-tetronate kinase [Microbacterium sp.]|uniref:3-oxo-tetronate kinase n=1 Tax=Microbacterium sp. TaxID=51671 RepID=UPI0039E5BCC4